MPGLEIRYLGLQHRRPDGEEQGRPPGHGPAHQPRRTRRQGVRLRRPQPLYSLVPATITGHSNSFFNKYGDPSVSKAKTLLSKAGITTPVKLTLHYTTDHYGAATKQEFEDLKKQLNDSGLFDVTIQGAPWDTFRPAEQERRVRRLRHGLVPGLPGRRQLPGAVPRQGQLPQSPYANAKIIGSLIPESRREADRLTASTSLTEIQDIVADDVPCCRCGRATSTSPRATTSRAPSGRSTPPRRCSSGNSAAV